MPVTTLEVARGNKRHFTIGERKNQMLPIQAKAICKTPIQTSEYLLEQCLFYIANAMPEQAALTAREALSVELRRWFVKTYRKPQSTIHEPERLLIKLRSGCHIAGKDHRQLKRLLKSGKSFSYLEFEDTVGAIRRLAGLGKGGAV